MGAFAGVVVAFVAVLQLAVVGPMNRGFDDLRAEMNQRFDQQDTYMNARFDAVDQRFDATDQRLNRLADEISQLRTLVGSIGDRVSRNEGQIQVIRQQLQTVDAPVP